MKKSLLVFLLAVALVTPAFAATSAKKSEKTVSKQETKKETKFDIVGKIGLTINPQIKTYTDYYEYDFSGNAKNSFMVGVEGLYKFDDKISAGIGINYISAADFDTTMDCYWDDYGSKMSIGFTNIYATIKPKLSDSIYAIAQIGYGVPNFKCAKLGGEKLWDVSSGGIYGGLGAGVDYKSFIVEAIYSVNSANIESKYYNYPDTIDDVFRYSTLSVNIGYKFSL